MKCILLAVSAPVGITFRLEMMMQLEGSGFENVLF
jgi:hypothetical protein